LIFFSPHGWQACETRFRGRASATGAGGGVDKLAAEEAAMAATRLFFVEERERERERGSVQAGQE
jgi:hypothetical protein